MNGNEKQENYRSLKAKLKKALQTGFFYEAIFVEYALLQDRVESMLRHALPNGGLGERQSISRSLGKLELALPKIGMRKPMPASLFEETREWIKERNTLVHALAKFGNDDLKVEEIAKKGKEILRQIDNASARVSRHFHAD